MERTLTADISWLAAVRANGQTPDTVTIIVNSERLPGDGTYTGNLTFHSDLGSVTVPVTATMINVPMRNVYRPMILR